MDAILVDDARKAPGDWSPQACRTVATELTNTLDLGPNRTAVIEALVFIHFSVYNFAERLRRRQGRRYHQSPRHFLSFIEYYVQVSQQKRGELEDQQRFLLVGLDKLKATVDQVEELQKSLAVKRTQLEAKNAEANDKLQSMVKDQQEAEQKQSASIQLQAVLEKKELEISERREVVLADLNAAEPAVREAQASVSNIKKQHLTEVRSMANPPLPVKNAMESVCIILGHKIESWKTVQGIIRRDDFIASIVNFDTDRQMTRQIREKMRRDYLDKPDYNYETINRASKACGPLAKWVIAQVEYSGILDRVGPLREEVNSLEREADVTKHQAEEIVDMIADLEAKIARYKDEYAALISETQAIKGEMERVQNRVSRSMQLLGSLSSEQERWETGSRTFDDQMSTIVGDALLSAAMLAYAGFFDQQYREAMWQYWSLHLAEADVKFKPELSFADYLSTADERIEWQSRSLPADTLCTENAIMLKRWNRYPLIIDPSGQATSFLLNEYKAQKLTVTSFLDDAFLKALESSLRFGNPLLIQDVENLDPVLNPVLNKELRRTGGRVLIRLGSQDIDFSPSFNMFLSTRDPSVEFSPDICSRVTFVNFTMTRGSLQSQSLDQVLKVERPDTDKKRTDLMKLQGEFRLRLRHLERSLLTALNESKGNILDDDHVIDTLETLKKEAAEVTCKVEETEAVMHEVEQVTAEYVPLAKACSSVFFVLDQLNLISHFYQFSLRFFLDIFDYILRRNPHLDGVRDPKQRLEILMRDLFLVVFRRTSKALAHHDHIMLAMLLAQIKAREGGAAETLEGDEYEFLLEGGSVGVQVGGGSSSADGEADDNDGGSARRGGDGNLEAMLDADQLARIQAFKKLAFFRPIEEHMEAYADEWLVFLQSNSPETVVPRFWTVAEGESAGLAGELFDMVRKMLVVKCLRPDRIVQAMAAFTAHVFGQDVLGEPGYDLGQIVEEVDASTPIALCSVPGYDASYRVDNLVKLVGARCTPVAMGSQEGFALADHAITAGARTGNWVLLKNVHLAPSWLSQLEKKMHSLSPNRNFRLFLTCETSPSIPVNFLRASRILMNEPPPGIRASMLDSLRGIAPSRLQRGPAETPRLFFLLAFFHATLTERLRYTPLGWSKPFEFNDSDAETALDTIEGWVMQIAKGRANIDPASIPWDAIRTLLKQSVYGGKIDNVPDQTLLDSFVDELFSPAAYESGFALVKDDKDPLIAPEGTKMDSFISWVHALPEQQPPQWLALPPSAEKVIAAAQGTALLIKLVKMKQLADDDDDDDKVGGGGAGTAGASSAASWGGAGSGAVAAVSASVQPAWMKGLRANAVAWLRTLPAKVSSLRKDANSISDPLYRFWAREHRSGAALLATVQEDLEAVIAVCDGEARQTNHNRMLLTELPKGTIPANWKRYAVPKAMLLAIWIVDLRARLEQLERITKEDRFDAFQVTLGLLFAPGAYLTATRQAVAHRSGTSLENLKLELELDHKLATSDQQQQQQGKFAVQGLKLQGAEWTEDAALIFNDGSTIGLRTCRLSWIAADAVNGGGEGGQGKKRNDGKVPITVYLNEDRSHALFSVELHAPGLEASTVAQRAVALRAS